MVVFITGNANKLKEFRQIIGDVRVNSKSLDLIEIQGSAEDVCIAKSKEASALANGPTIVEDTCLCFNALDSLPGPYIKSFLSKLGTKGLVKLLHGWEDKSAYALCTFAYCEGPGCEPILFQGRTNGTIVEPRGKTDFGWDPIFMPDGFTTTYAEMDKEEKNKISHRYRALEKLRPFLQSLE